MTKKLILLLFITSMSAWVARAQYALDNVGSSFFTEYRVVDDSGKVVDLPEMIKEALFMPQIAEIHNKSMLYFNHRDTLFEYNIENRTIREMLRPVSGTGCICGLAWSPDSNYVLVLAINTETASAGDIHQYLYLVHVNGSRPPSKALLPVNFTIPGLCDAKAGKDFYFIDNTTVCYKIHLSSASDGGKLKSVSVSLFK